MCFNPIMFFSQYIGSDFEVTWLLTLGDDIPTVSNTAEVTAEYSSKQRCISEIHPLVQVMLRKNTPSCFTQTILLEKQLA